PPRGSISHRRKPTSDPKCSDGDLSAPPYWRKRCDFRAPCRSPQRGGATHAWHGFQRAAATRARPSEHDCVGSALSDLLANAPSAEAPKLRHYTPATGLRPQWRDAVQAEHQYHEVQLWIWFCGP